MIKNWLKLKKKLLKRGETSGRSDDTNESVIRARIQEYRDKTAVVADYYKQFDKVAMIKGEGTIDEIFERLCMEIDKRGWSMAGRKLMKRLPVGGRFFVLHCVANLALWTRKNWIFSPGSIFLCSKIFQQKHPENGAKWMHSRWWSMWPRSLMCQ